MPQAPLDEIGTTDDDAGLRAAEQLVAAEGHERGAVGEVCTAAGSPASQAGGPPGSHGHVGVDQPAADVDDHGHVQGGQFPTDVSSTKPSTR